MGKLIKKIWNDQIKDNVLSGLYLAALLAIFGSIGGVLVVIVIRMVNNIPWYESIQKFWMIINYKIEIPIWPFIIILLFIILFVIRKIRKRKSRAPYINKNIENLKLNENKETGKTDSRLEVFFAKPGFNYTFNSNILNNNEGTFSVWGLVSNNHYELGEKRRYLYLVSHALNEGKEHNNPLISRYPNSWAIVRRTPSKNDTTGEWVFFCYGMERTITEIKTSSILNGWHLFTVSWSKKDNLIIFIIDDKTIGESSFVNWPEELSPSMYLGTWPSRHPSHFFNSKLSNYIFKPMKYTKIWLNTILSNKPI